MIISSKYRLSFPWLLLLLLLSIIGPEKTISVDHLVGSVSPDGVLVDVGRTILF